MNDQPNIVLIGAGSVVFTREVLSDLLHFSELRKCRLTLHDIDSERLETARLLALRIAVQRGAAPDVRCEGDRRRALDGADFVINTVQIGGVAATRADMEIPERYGLHQTIADTLGVGGIFRALRTFPFLEALASDMQQVCPGAMLLNYTNPMAMNITYLSRIAPDVKVVGLCHSVYWTVVSLCDLIGVPLHEVSYFSAGVNHQAWLLRWTRENESLYPLLDARIAEDPQLQRRVRVDMYRRFGYFPTESSEHSSEYVPWYLHADDEIERLRLVPNEYITISESNATEHERLAGAVRAGDDVAMGENSEYAPQVIHSILTDTPRRIVGTVANDRLIDDLPSGTGVEVPVVVDGDGVHAIRVGTIPPVCAALNRNFLNVVDLTVTAALTGDARLVRQAAMLDPNTAASLRVDQIWTLCDELTACHHDLIAEPLRDPVRL